MVELVEKRVAKGRQDERAAKVEKVAAIKATIPAPAYLMLLAEAKLPDRVLRALLDVDFKNVGQVMEQMALDEDRILGLEGFGPKMLDETRRRPWRPLCSARAGRARGCAGSAGEYWRRWRPPRRCSAAQPAARKAQR